MHVLVRDARAFSCVGSGVDDLKLVHAAGEGVGRLPDSASSSCVGLCPPSAEISLHNDARKGGTWRHGGTWTNPITDRLPRLFYGLMTLRLFTLE